MLRTIFICSLARGLASTLICPLLLLATSLWDGPNTAAAQELPLALDWRAPRDCPDQAAVERDTRKMIARLPEDASAHPLSARVRVVSRAGGYEATLDTEQDGATGQRTLRDPRCGALARAVALVLALTLNADLVEDPDAEPTPEPAPDPAPPEVNPPAPPPPPAPTSEVRMPAPRAPREPLAVTLTAGVDVGVATALVPDAGGFGQLRVAAGLLGASLELRGGASLPRSMELQGSSDGSARFVAVQGALAGCYEAGSRLRLGACAGGELAWLRGESRGVSEPGTDAGTFFRAFVDGLCSFALPHHVDLRATLSGTRAFSAPAFGVRELGRVYRPNTYGVRFAVGAGVRF